MTGRDVSRKEYHFAPVNRTYLETGDHDSTYDDEDLQDKSRDVNDKLSIRIEHLLEDVGLLREWGFLRRHRWEDDVDQFADLDISNELLPGDIWTVHEDLDDSRVRFGLALGQLARVFYGPSGQNSELLWGMVLGLTGESNLEKPYPGIFPKSDFRGLKEHETVRIGRLLKGVREHHRNRREALDEYINDRSLHFKQGEHSYSGDGRYLSPKRIIASFIGDASRPLLQGVEEQLPDSADPLDLGVIRDAISDLEADTRVREAKRLREWLKKDEQRLHDIYYGSDKKAWGDAVFEEIYHQRSKQEMSPSKNETKLLNDMALKGERTGVAEDRIQPTWGNRPLLYEISKETTDDLRLTSYGDLLARHMFAPVDVFVLIDRYALGNRIRPDMGSLIADAIPDEGDSLIYRPEMHGEQESGEP